MINDFAWLPATAEHGRPPGPKGLPLVGSLFDARDDPLGFMMNLVRSYGDIAYYRIGPYTGYLVTHPDDVQHVLQSNHRNYSKENYNYERLKSVLGEGLITSNGDHWRRERRLIQPVFHREYIAHVGSTTTEATLDLLKRWDGRAEPDQPMDVAAEMMHLTLRIVGKALFGIDISADTTTVGRAFTTLNEDISYRFRTVFVPPLWVPTPRNRAFKKARAELDRVVYEMIAQRRQRASGRGEDLLDLLLTARDEASGQHMTDRQLRDEMVTLLLAGHETTAMLLTWTWYLLSKNPATARTLGDELDQVLGGRVPTAEDLSELTYTKMVIQESLRLYPPVWIISRTAIEDDEIGGYTIPADSVVTLSSYATHRHTDFWENPEGFDPERFSPERREGRHRYAYVPFGGGPRYCIGRNFAMMEAQLILATIAQRFALDVVPGHAVEPDPLVTLRPQDGLKMTLRSRQP